jgi:predicted permease
MTVALLVGAGLLTKSFYHLLSTGPGFESDGVFTARVMLPSARYGERDSRTAFFDRLIGGLAEIPGVTAAGYTSALPFSGEDLAATINIDGYEARAGASPPVARLRSIDRGYFRSLDVPVVTGRNFAAVEDERVAIVDEVFADSYWPSESALGKRVRYEEDPESLWYTVIGVVSTLKHESLTDQTADGTIYWHYRQRPSLGGFVTLRTTLPPMSLEPSVVDVVASIDPDIPLFDSTTLVARIAGSLGAQRTPMALTLAFASAALALATVGIYGILNWAVTRRTGEIGVRMALGARGTDIVAMVLRDGAKLMLIGLIAGVFCALALARIVSSQIHVGAMDPTVFAGAILVLAATAMLASWLPARRAARIDPMAALRNE